MNRPSDIGGMGAYYEPRIANRQATYYQRHEQPQVSANRPAALDYPRETQSYDYRTDDRRSQYRDPQRPGGTAPMYSQGAPPDYNPYDPRYSPTDNYQGAGASGQSPSYPRDYDPRAGAGAYPNSRPGGYYPSEQRAPYRDDGYPQQPYPVYPKTSANSAGSSYGPARYRAGGGATGRGEPGVARLEGFIQDPSVRTSSHDSARPRLY